MPRRPIKQSKDEGIGGLLGLILGAATGVNIPLGADAAGIAETEGDVSPDFKGDPSSISGPGQVPYQYKGNPEDLLGHAGFVSPSGKFSSQPFSDTRGFWGKIAGQPSKEEDLNLEYANAGLLGRQDNALALQKEQSMGPIEAENYRLLTSPTVDRETLIRNLITKQVLEQAKGLSQIELSKYREMTPEVAIREQQLGDIGNKQKISLEQGLTPGVVNRASQLGDIANEQKVNLARNMLPIEAEKDFNATAGAKGLTHDQLLTLSPNQLLAYQEGAKATAATAKTTQAQQATAKLLAEKTSPYDIRTGVAQGERGAYNAERGQALTQNPLYGQSLDAGTLAGLLQPVANLQKTGQLNIGAGDTLLNPPVNSLFPQGAPTIFPQGGIGHGATINQEPVTQIIGGKPYVTGERRVTTPGEFRTPADPNIVKKILGGSNPQVTSMPSYPKPNPATAFQVPQQGQPIVAPPQVQPQLSDKDIAAKLSGQISQEDIMNLIRRILGSPSSARGF